MKKEWGEKEKKLKKTEGDYEKRIDSIYDVIYEIDNKGRFTFISDSIKRYGYKPENLTGKHF